MGRVPPTALQHEQDRWSDGHYNDQIIDQVIDLLGSPPSSVEPSTSCGMGRPGVL